MSYLSSKFSFFKRQKGLGFAISKTFYAAVRRFTPFELNPLLNRRIKLSRKISKFYNNTIQKGPLKGVVLPDSFGVRGWTKSSIILGQYEAPVVAALDDFSSVGCNQLVDIGAADGFYAVSCLSAGLFKRALCFESSPKMREALLSWASLANLNSDIKVLCEASSDFHENLSPNEWASSVLLIDIDGGEFEMLNQSVFANLPSTPFIVEMHELLFSDSDAKVNSLLAAAEATHSTHFVFGDVRDLSDVELPDGMSDVDLFIASVEGRPWMGKWALFIPRLDKFDTVRKNFK